MKVQCVLKAHGNAIRIMKTLERRKWFEELGEEEKKAAFFLLAAMKELPGEKELGELGFPEIMEML